MSMGTDSDTRLDCGHTPLPWQALEPDEIDVFVPIIGVRLGEDGEPLETPTNGLVGGATLFPTEIDAEDYERAKANAAFIVRAANSHYELLAALEETWRVLRAAGLLHLASGVQLGQTSWYVKICDAERMSDAAIRKASGQSPIPLDPSLSNKEDNPDGN